MPFEYDREKSRTNKDKHGIDFEEAQEIWSDAKAIEDKTTYRDEERFYRIGRIGSKLWTAFFTYRSGNTRLISVRRARRQETAAYYGRGS